MLCARTGIITQCLEDGDRILDALQREGPNLNEPESPWLRLRYDIDAQ